MLTATGSIAFDSMKGSGPREASTTVVFDQAIIRVVALLRGMDVKFSKNDGDHHFGNLTVQLDSSLQPGNQVEVTATFGLRDWSGNWDDRYEGIIFFTLVADTPAPQPAPGALLSRLAPQPE